MSTCEQCGQAQPSDTPCAMCNPSRDGFKAIAKATGGTFVPGRDAMAPYEDSVTMTREQAMAFVHLPRDVAWALVAARRAAQARASSDLGDHAYTPDERAKMNAAYSKQIRTEAVLFDKIGEWLRSLDLDE
jgi:hypothetical protein